MSKFMLALVAAAGISLIAMGSTAQADHYCSPRGGYGHSYYGPSYGRSSYHHRSRSYYAPGRSIYRGRYSTFGGPHYGHSGYGHSNFYRGRSGFSFSTRGFGIYVR